MSTIKTETLSTPSNATVPVDTVVNGTAKAWVNFIGQGTVAIRRAFNVSTITDNGPGDYTVNFINAMVDADYSIVGTSGYTANGASAGFFVTNRIGSNGNESAPTTTSCRVNGVGQNGSVYDTKYMHVAIFR